jgi:hypothetical protein
MYLHVSIIEPHTKAAEDQKEGLTFPNDCIDRSGKCSNRRGETTSRSKLLAGVHISIRETRFKVIVSDEAGERQGWTSLCCTFGYNASDEAQRIMDLNFIAHDRLDGANGSELEHLEATTTIP